MADKETMMMVNSLVWAQEKGLYLRDGIRFDLKGVPYLQGIIKAKKKITNCKKGAQMCLTTAIFINAVHSHKYHKYNQNIMYMMPSQAYGRVYRIWVAISRLPTPSARVIRPVWTSCPTAARL